MGIFGEDGNLEDLRFNGPPDPRPRAYEQCSTLHLDTPHLDKTSAIAKGIAINTRSALGDVFYTMLTGKSPFELAADYPTLAADGGGTLQTADESPIGMAQPGGWVVMFKAKLLCESAHENSHENSHETAWMPLRMGGSWGVDDSTNIRAMDRDHHSGMQVLIRATTRLVDKSALGTPSTGTSQLVPEPVARFVAENAYLPGSGKLPLEVVSDGTFKKSLVGSYDNRLGSITTQDLQEACSTDSGCLGSLVSCCRVIRAVSAPAVSATGKPTTGKQATGKPYGIEITLSCAVDRGRKIGDLPPGAAFVRRDRRYVSMIQPIGGLPFDL